MRSRTSGKKADHEIRREKVDVMTPPTVTSVTPRDLLPLDISASPGGRADTHMLALQFSKLVPWTADLKRIAAMCRLS